MSITANADLIEWALWPQGDKRDPLGIWAFRSSILGDATGGFLKLLVGLPAARRAGHIYTCLSAQSTTLSGTATHAGITLRLLTNWPPADLGAGVTAYSTYMRILIGASAVGNFPTDGPFENPLVRENDRFILLFDPRPVETLGRLNIMEFIITDNTNTVLIGFEAWGYWWDRSVMDAPGGPRHPGT